MGWVEVWGGGYRHMCVILYIHINIYVGISSRNSGANIGLGGSGGGRYRGGCIVTLVYMHTYISIYIPAFLPEVLGANIVLGG